MALPAGIPRLSENCKNPGWFRVTHGMIEHRSAYGSIVFRGALEVAHYRGADSWISLEAGAVWNVFA